MKMCFVCQVGCSFRYGIIKPQNYSRFTLNQVEITPYYKEIIGTLHAKTVFLLFLVGNIFEIFYTSDTPEKNTKYIYSKMPQTSI